MSLVVYRYAFDLHPEPETVTRLALPAAASILGVELRDGRGSFWALVRPDNPSKVLIVTAYWTGRPIREAPPVPVPLALAAAGRHLGSIRDPRPGMPSWHVFARWEEPEPHNPVVMDAVVSDKIASPMGEEE